MKRLRFIIVLFVVSFASISQNAETRFVIETTFNDTIPVLYEQNYGSLKFNSTTGDLTFSTNLANFKTGNKITDSLLSEKKQIQFTFQGNLDQNLFKIVGEENDDKLHKITGNILVNNISYFTDAYVSVENFSDKSAPSKILLDLKLEVDPKVVVIPYLSNYFNHVLLFQINNGVIMK